MFAKKMYASVAVASLFAAVAVPAAFAEDSDPVEAYRNCLTAELDKGKSAGKSDEDADAAAKEACVKQKEAADRHRRLQDAGKPQDGEGVAKPAAPLVDTEAGLIDAALLESIFKEDVRDSNNRDIPGEEADKALDHDKKPEAPKVDKKAEQKAEAKKLQDRVKAEEKYLADAQARKAMYCAVNEDTNRFVDEAKCLEAKKDVEEREALVKAARDAVVAFGKQVHEGAKPADKPADKPAEKAEKKDADKAQSAKKAADKKAAAKKAGLAKTGATAGVVFGFAALVAAAGATALRARKH